jgi:hypothetical protein
MSIDHYRSFHLFSSMVVSSNRSESRFPFFNFLPSARSLRRLPHPAKNRIRAFAQIFIDTDVIKRSMRVEFAPSLGKFMHFPNVSCCPFVPFFLGFLSFEWSEI